MAKYFLFFFYFVYGGFSYSQNELSQWYFGVNAGLDFLTSPPTILINSGMNTIEGCSSISDASGNILFYSDGATVYNSSHLAMANGTGLFGNNSASQACIILKKPGSTSLYYIFTIQGIGGVAGLNYSIIDMTLASGQGSVTVKNSPLYSAGCYEKITGTRHCNGVDYWILSHEMNSSNFRAFQLTSAGMNTTAVVSNIGSAVGSPYSLGCMKISPNGKKLGMAEWHTPGDVDLFDFDNSTGVISNSITLITNYSSYGCEFSPDGTKFYAGSFGGSSLKQWDLCAGSPTAVVASAVTISSGNPWSMQRGADGKIYVARNGNMLGVIQNPNLAGISCNYTDNGQSIAPKVASRSLPNFINSDFYSSTPAGPFSYSVSNAYGCQSASFTAPSIVQNFTTNTCSAMGYSLVGMLWNFGDPASGLSNTSTLTNPLHAFPNLGTYTVQLIIYYSCGTANDTLRQAVNINQPCISVASTSITCANLGSATVQATGGLGPFSYTWMPSAQTSSVATGLSPGTYTLTVLDFGNNFTYTATTVFTSLIPLSGSVAASGSISCFGAATGTGAVTNLVGGSGSQTFLWTNTSQSYTTAFTNSLSAGIWSVNVTDATTGCQINDAFFIAQPPQLFLNVSSNTPTVCVSGSIALTGTTSGGTPGYTYTWTNTSSSFSTIVSQTIGGNYIYTLSSEDANACLITNTIAVDFIAIPVLSVPNISICPLAVGTLSASGATSFTWTSPSSLSGQGSTFTDSPVSNAQYTVLGSAMACTSIATASIILHALPIPVLQTNSPRCQGTSVFVNASGGSVYQWAGPSSFSSFLPLNTILNLGLNHAGVYNLTVTSVNGCTAATSATVVVNPTPTLATNGATICNTQTLNLSANSVPGASFLWTGPLGFTSLSQNVTITNPPLIQSGNFVIQVTSVAGCTNSAVASVLVISPPNMSVALSSASICAQSLNGSPNVMNISVTGANTYTLYPSALMAVSGLGPVFSMSPLSPFSSTPSIASAIIIGSNGVCSSSTSTNFSVVPNPTLSFNVSQAQICAGQSFTYQVNGATNYYWVTGVPGLSTHFGAVTVANPTSTSIYSVSGTRLGCSSATESTTLTVFPLPIVKILPVEPLICLHNKINLYATGTGTSFTWTPYIGMSNNTGSLVIASPSVTQSYTVLAAANNCTSTAVTTVTVLNLPKPSISVSRSLVCLGDMISMHGFGGMIYNWYGPANLFYQGADISFNIISANMAGQYTLTVTDENACKSSTVSTIGIASAPIGALLDFKEFVCEPYCTSYHFAAANHNPNILTTWYINNLQSPSENNVLSPCFASAGTYTINGKIMDNYTGCKNDIQYILNVNPKPVADFNFAPKTPIAYQDEVIFTNTSIGDNQNKWSWFLDNDNGIFSKTQNTSYLFKESGNFSMAMIVSNIYNCTDTVVKGIYVEPDFSIYVPNAFTPNGDGYNDVFFPVIRVIENYNMKIYNRWGQEIFYTADINKAWDGTFNGESCKQDVYAWFIELITKNGEKKSLSGTVTLLR